MKKYCPDNERIKRKYLVFLKEAKRQNEASIDAVAKALNRFEEYTKYQNFKAFRHEKAVGFKKYLANQDNQQTGKKLSKATLNSTLRHLKCFFQWLSQCTGYRSRLNYTDAEYFNLSEKEVRVTAKREKPVPTIEQIKHVINSMPVTTVIDRRDRSLIAFTLLTGARDKAIASMKLKHLDMAENCFYQDAREVETKFSKTFTTTFFPVGGEIRQIIEGWVTELIEERLFGNDDPLFPKTRLVQNKNKCLESSGLLREHWTTTSPIRKIFKKRFLKAGLPYFNPHSFRDTLSKFGQRICQTPEEFKAWSQNLGHEKVLTTFFSYGEVQSQRQAEIIQLLQYPREKQGLMTDAKLDAIMEKLGV